jgi:predicted RNA binding protein YcfA (HicA-like mRNA interferase family)
MSISSREVTRLLKLAGWLHLDTGGSHWQFVHPTRPGRVTVPHPKHDLPVGTVRSIEKQSGVILRRFQ